MSTLVVFFLFLVGALACTAVSSSFAASRCDSIRSKFDKKVRPQMLRVAKKRLRGGNWFLVTLKKKQEGKHPSLSEINEVTKEMLASCSTKKCRAYAKEISAASIEVYKINRNWAKAGCKGKIDD